MTIEELYDPDAWRLAAAVADQEKITKAGVKAALRDYRQEKGVRRLTRSTELEALVFERAHVIAAVRVERSQRRERKPELPLPQRMTPELRALGAWLRDHRNFKVAWKLGLEDDAAAE